MPSKHSSSSAKKRPAASSSSLLARKRPAKAEPVKKADLSSSDDDGDADPDCDPDSDSDSSSDDAPVRSAQSARRARRATTPVLPTRQAPGRPSYGEATSKIRCRCRQGFCLVKVVRKEGPNRGREFLACPQSLGVEDNGCGYFAFLDDVVAGKGPPPTNGPPCPCKGGFSRIIIARTPTNDGRLFASCPKRTSSEPGCGYFQWLDEIPCQCGEGPCKLLTVRKENQNKGRMFLKCHLSGGPGKDGEPGLKNAWLRQGAAGAEWGTGFNRDLDEAAYRKFLASCGDFEVEKAIYVQCFNAPSIEEAKWTLDMVENPDSLVAGVIAEIPVHKGGTAVQEFLALLRQADGTLPAGLKGGRVVLLPDLTLPPDHILDKNYQEGLKELEGTGLHYEIACRPAELPHVAETVRRFPNLNFCLNHCGHNDGKEDLEQWAQDLALVAQNPNVFCKLGASEEWGVAHPPSYIEKAIGLFGADRVLYESNWFVNIALGDTHERSFQHVMEALERLNLNSEETIQKVFRENARRFYRLD